MSFYREQKFLQEQPREVRQIKKNLPFTVTDIGGAKELAAWKVAKAEKQQKWDDGRAARYASAKQRAVDVIQGKQASIDPQAEVEKQYNERQAALVKQVCRPETVIPKQTFFQRMSGRVVDFFLNLKFE